jgi:hypothetical protein
MFQAQSQVARDRADFEPRLRFPVGNAIYLE